MAFIPNKNKFAVGTRVRLTRTTETCTGVFTKGHEFIVAGDSGNRGIDCIDDEGNQLLECPESAVEVIQSFLDRATQREFWRIASRYLPKSSE